MQNKTAHHLTIHHLSSTDVCTVHDRRAVVFAKAKLLVSYSIGQFFGTTIFLLSLSSAMTVGIIKLHFSGEHGARVPGWMRTLVLDCIAKCLRISSSSSQEDAGDGWQQKKV